MTQMVNIYPWCNTSGYILCAWDSGLAAREQADAPKGAVGDDLPALSGALVVRSLPLLYYLYYVPPYRGELRSIRGGGPIPPAGQPIIRCSQQFFVV